MTESNKKEKITTTGRGRRGRTSGRKSRVLSDEQLKASIKNKLEEQQAKEKEAEQKAANKDKPETPALDKDALATEYKDMLTAYDVISQSVAEKKTSVSEQNARRDAAVKKTQAEKDKLNYDFAVQKAEQIQKFVEELNDIQDALGTVAKDLEDLAEDDDRLKNFVDGLGGVKQTLSSIFEKYAAKDVSEPAASTSMEAKAYTPETVNALEITDETKPEDVKAAIDALTEKLTEATEAEAKLSKDLETASDMAQRAEENSEAEIERTAKDLERKSPFVLEKIAKDVLQVADNLERAVQALEPQKEALGETFNVVSGKVGKAYDELQDAFNKFGIKKVDTAIGQDPDVEFDNVVAQISTPPNVTAEKGQIVMIDRVGYKLNNRVIRESTVAVAAN